MEAYILFENFYSCAANNHNKSLFLYLFEDHYPYLDRLYLIMQNFPPEQKVPIWPLIMVGTIDGVLLVGIYYKSKTIFLMHKKSYRFNFVQRIDITIFCYCLTCLPTRNSFLMHKKSYGFNFVQRIDITIFCYCLTCLPTCNSEMFHIPCRYICTHVTLKCFYVPCSFIYAQSYHSAILIENAIAMQHIGISMFVFCRALPLVIFMIWTK